MMLSDSDTNNRRDRDGDSDLSRMGRAGEKKISINMLINIDNRGRKEMEWRTSSNLNYYQNKTTDFSWNTNAEKIKFNNTN